jgi:hypothetical protein
MKELLVGVMLWKASWDQSAKGLKKLNADDFFSEGPSAVQTNISTVYEGNAELQEKNR